MSTRRPLLILLVVFVALMTVFLMTQKPQGTSAANAVPAPELEIPLQPNAAPVKLSALKGKVVILDFWATWCGPCKMAIPGLQKMHERYAAQGLQVIGVSADDATTQGDIPAVQKELGMTYPIVIAEKIPGIRDKYAASSLPTVYLIDKEGKVRQRDEGYSDVSMRELESQVQTLLKE